MGRIGEPYVTSRRRTAAKARRAASAFGFFIAKTLLERSGATVDFVNRRSRPRGGDARALAARRNSRRRHAGTRRAT